MEQNGFHLYNELMARVKAKKHLNENKDYTAIYHTLTDLNKNNAKIIYMLILHHYIIESGVQPDSLKDKKLTFYNQKVSNTGLGVRFNGNMPNDVVDMLYEFIIMSTDESQS